MPCLDPSVRLRDLRASVLQLVQADRAVPPGEPHPFYFDESLLGVGKAITIARRDSIHVGHPLIEADFPLGIVDAEWLPKVAARDWVVFLRDRRIRTKPAELLAFREHRVRVFWVAGKKNLSVWGTLVRLVNHWQRIERIVLSRGPGPWFTAINESEIVEVPIVAEKAERSPATNIA